MPNLKEICKQLFKVLPPKNRRLTFCGRALYSAACAIRAERRLSVSEVTVEWHEITVARCIVRAAIDRTIALLEELTAALVLFLKSFIHHTNGSTIIQ